MGQRPPGGVVWAGSCTAARGNQAETSRLSGAPTTLLDPRTRAVDTVRNSLQSHGVRYGSLRITYPRLSLHHRATDSPPRRRSLGRWPWSRGPPSSSRGRRSTASPPRAGGRPGRTAAGGLGGVSWCGSARRHRDFLAVLCSCWWFFWAGWRFSHVQALWYEFGPYLVTVARSSGLVCRAQCSAQCSLFVQRSVAFGSSRG